MVTSISRVLCRRKLYSRVGFVLSFVHLPKSRHETCYRNDAGILPISLYRRQALTTMLPSPLSRVSRRQFLFIEPIAYPDRQNHGDQ
jgi:hypothetical protein